MNAAAGGMPDTSFLQTLFFLLSMLFAAWWLLGLRLRRAPLALDTLWIAAILPAALLGWAFLMGGQFEQLRLSVNRLQLPLAEVHASPDTARFVVGDQNLGSDLVVSPFADPERSREVSGPETRPLAVIHADRGAEGVRAWLCIYNHPADIELEQPGWLVTTTGETEVRRAAQPPENCDIALPAGSEVKVDVRRADPGDVATDDRRSFTIRRTPDAVRVILDSPLTADLGPCGANSLRLLPAHVDPDRLTYLPQPDLRFAALGGGGAHPLLDPMRLGDAMDPTQVCFDQQRRYRWPAAAGPAKVEGIVKHDVLPWFLVILTGASGLVLCAVRGASWRHERLEAAVVFGVQWLLALRTMIAAAGLYNDPESNRQPLLLDAAIAYVCVPVMLAALMMRGGSDKKRGILALGGFTALAAVATGINLVLASATGGFREYLTPAALLFGTAVLLFVRYRSGGETPLLTRLTARLDRLGNPWTLGLWIVWLGGAARLALAFVGWLTGVSRLSERIGPLGLSVIYQPLMIGGFALLTVALLAAPSIRRAWCFAVTFAFALAVVPMGIRDFGILMVYGAPVAMVAAWIIRRRLYRTRLIPALLGASPLIAPLAVLALAGGLARLADGPGETVTAQMQYAVDWDDDNLMRLVRWAEPDRVERFGNRAAYRTLDQAAGLEPLAGNLLGHGYLAPSHVRRPLLDYQFTDNVTAVHLMWPFGRLGMIGVLAFLSALCVVLQPPAKMLRDDATIADRVSVIAARMAALTVLWAGVYMTLANLNIVPFTGRDVYFLGAVGSGSSLVEALILVLIAAAAGLRAEREPSS